MELLQEDESSLGLGQQGTESATTPQSSVGPYHTFLVKKKTSPSVSIDIYIYTYISVCLCLSVVSVCLSVCC